VAIQQPIIGSLKNGLWFISRDEHITIMSSGLKCLNQINFVSV